MLSTFATVKPITTVTRYDKRQYKRLPVDCPNIIKIYNKHMVGLDFLNDVKFSWIKLEAHWPKMKPIVKLNWNG